MRRYTLIYHRYLGVGSAYVIDFKRVTVSEKRLKALRREPESELHFILSGWPTVAFPGGMEWFKGGTDKPNV